MSKRFIAVILTGIILLSCVPFSASAAEADEIRKIADGIAAWKKSDVGATSDGYLINERFLELAGTTPGDWFPIGLSRLGVEDNYNGYLAVIKDRIEARYAEPGKFSAAKATEWHRITLAVLAASGDPTAIGSFEGNTINLIADGTYDRGKVTPLGRQGINGWIWGLIALDSKRYEIPEGAFYSRNDIIVEILSKQLSDGGFALSGKTADPDITAMAIQALSPYYNSEKVYTYTLKETKKEVKKTVYEVIEEALNTLSSLQLDTGDFASWGTQNVESTDQVTVALCCLGIDPLSDPRFIKNGNTLLDGILRYRMPDGGFIHSFTYDPDNPTSLPDQSNTMASEQTLYTMAALWRQKTGMRYLYDFRPEQSTALKERIAVLEEKIGALSGNESTEMLEALLKEFYSLPENEREYVKNYRRLSALSKKAGMDITVIAGNTAVVESPKDEGNDDVLLYFSASDKAAVDKLPTELTTEQYVLVTSLLDKLVKSEDFADKERYLQKLTSTKAEIASIQAEIDSINADIKEKLYPFENITLKDKRTVDSIVRLYQALSDYDKSKILRYEDVLKMKTKLDNMLRAIIITVILTVVCAVLISVFVTRIRKRKNKKRLEMEAFAAMYENDDN